MRGSRLPLLWLFLLGPVAGLALAIVLAAAAHLGPSLLDIGLAAGLFVVTGHGVTVGFHRYFTHGSFRANRTLKIALAVAGSLSLEGDVTGWVATHRLHHARSDRDGDPHSPWRYGTGSVALAKGLVWAQVGWFFANQPISKQRYAPDLIADDDIRRIDRVYPLWAVLTVLGPAVVGGVVTLSWTGALTAFLWAGLARILLLHHVTWAINSLCHVVGTRPFRSRDHAANVWPLALLSLGESWHNLHHVDPTCARHGVDRGQLDSSAALIRVFERCGWATKVRWPDPIRLQGHRVAPSDLSA
jgi:stearoyl-CoA desaturase (delta-9 desaturase)